MAKQFNVEFLPPAVEFLESIDSKAREKIYRNMLLAQQVNDIELLKKLNGSIWEFRTLYAGVSYRLLAFQHPTDFHTSRMIVTHGFKKKSAKTPLREIQRAMLAAHRFFNT